MYPFPRCRWRYGKTVPFFPRPALSACRGRLPQAADASLPVLLPLPAAALLWLLRFRPYVRKPHPLRARPLSPLPMTWRSLPPAVSLSSVLC